jgi:hypothetical protein
VAYETFRDGKEIEGRQTHHECLNKWCCNPWHMKAVTQEQHQKEHPLQSVANSSPEAAKRRLAKHRYKEKHPEKWRAQRRRHEARQRARQRARKLAGIARTVASNTEGVASGFDPLKHWSREGPMGAGL